MLLLRNCWPTLVEALLGFFFGNLAAITLAIWFVHSQMAERAFYPDWRCSSTPSRSSPSRPSSC